MKPRTPGPRKGQPQAERRPSAEIRAEQIEYHQRQVERLAKLRRVQRLARTTKALKESRAKLEAARSGLAAEVEAVRSAVERGLHD
ncbi:hypothetical protein ACIO3O_02490 [Streptomyces sp. NPDC087440]|uniref:hypothetical protein n=1 Tax=Streptomyces sp. NPDC087440 TaxID=3365790 RepID=UPI0037F931EB